MQGNRNKQSLAMRIATFSMCAAVFGLGVLIADTVRFLPGIWRLLAALAAIGILWFALLISGLFFGEDTTDRDRRLRQ